MSKPMQLDSDLTLEGANNMEQHSGGSDLSTPKDRPLQSDEDEGSDMESETYENDGGSDPPDSEDQSPGKGQAKTLQKKKQARGRNKEGERDSDASSNPLWHCKACSEALHNMLQTLPLSFVPQIQTLRTIPTREALGSARHLYSCVETWALPVGCKY
ncbi:hypothetical protein NQZ68_026356 [Dissostichus eleginoides]|nr:hypothetical protein NQZ68_026356 [Dissostichus eleginoides]